MPGHARLLPGRVVVGVDGSPGSADAVAFAFDEAQARGVALHAVYVSPSRARPGLPASSIHRDDHERRGADDRMLHDATAGWQDKYPDIAVTHRVVHGDNPVRALNDATGDDDLMVVGARGLGGFAPWRSARSATASCAMPAARLPRPRIRRPDCCGPAARILGTAVDGTAAGRSAHAPEAPGPAQPARSRMY